MSGAASPSVPVPERVRIGLGLGTFPFSSPRVFWQWVELCEERGVDSLWHADRLVSGEPALEALSAMASLVRATERLRFGMNAVVVSWRDPLLLAKQCATIDFLSEGRLLPVFGVGNEFSPEWAATGRSPRRRGRRADEVLEIVRRLWSEEKVDFEGEFFQYREATISPRPVQQPLPLWIGGSSRAAMRRTARIGTGWLAGIQTPEQVAPVIAGIRDELRVTGREIDPDHYGAVFLYRIGSWEDSALSRLRGASSASTGGVDLRGALAVGDAELVCERVEAYRQAGASKFVLIPIAEGDADMLDQTERLVEEVLPRFHAAS